ncbi:MAG: hypothetical protein OEQ39_04160 [Gammaproteobacteria bacterium]|nr:hypothetical protein [Gammaproteobacteria bacterium]MDH3466194.1 hypothetical protein [Gammaproteobacteria bacterium]
MSKFETLIDELTEASDESPLASRQDAIDKAIDILHMIHQWTNAYPEHIFIPMTKEDWQVHHETLSRNGDARSGSAAAADCMRYVVTRMKESIEKMS